MPPHVPPPRGSFTQSGTFEPEASAAIIETCYLYNALSLSCQHAVQPSVGRWAVRQKDCRQHDDQGKAACSRPEVNQKFLLETQPAHSSTSCPGEHACSLLRLPLVH